MQYLILPAMPANRSSQLLTRAMQGEPLSVDEGIYLYDHCPTADLMFSANQMRLSRISNPAKVTWIIDRNLNTTNICVANCKFCNFFRPPGHTEGYVTDLETYRTKIEETISLGGEQLLLQGGHHPNLGLDHYTFIFKGIKDMFPNIKLHALGPPEIAHISELENKSHSYVLEKLMEAGLDSLPGAGAEILSDRVRKIISTGKCLSAEWLDIMRAAHRLGLTTSATMMFGHIETIRERFEHLVLIRQVQAEKPDENVGFIAFIPWPFMDDGTLLKRVRGVQNKVSAEEYIRMVALSRIMLPNIQNIQASWLTVGKSTAQICLHGGANDFGSIMIEENVVSAAGAPHRFTYRSIQDAITEAGFIPQLRDQQYNSRILPKNIQEQMVNY